MKIGDTTKTTHSTALRKRGGRKTQQVIYKTYIGKIKGKAKFSSRTRHEPV